MSALVDFNFVPETNTTESLYDINAIANKTAKPDHIKGVCKNLLLLKDGACYKEMEPFLRAPGVTGSKAFDQGNAVNVMLKHDWMLANIGPDGEKSKTTKNGDLRQIMINTKANERELWDRLVAVLRDLGMRFKHGRLVGAIALEDDSDDDGAPDIG